VIIRFGWSTSTGIAERQCPTHPEMAIGDAMITVRKLGVIALLVMALTFTACTSSTSSLTSTPPSTTLVTAHVPPTSATSAAALTTTSRMITRTTAPIAELKDQYGAGVFGSAVAVSGNTVVVGATASSRVFTYKEARTGWKQTAELTEGAEGHSIGYSVAISGATAVVGGLQFSPLDGHAYVFTQTSTGWKQVVELKGSDTVTADDGFGSSVGISGTTAIVGAPGHDHDSGRAYVFTRSRAGGWRQLAELKGSDTVARDDFGSSVASRETWP
jgi:hypothetical protein